MKATDNTVEWVKIGSIRQLTLISKDVICYATGCFIKFLNIHTNDELKLDVNFPSVNGDGVGVLDGHRSLYVFCYAENCRYPSLYVKTYPAFKTIVKIPGGPSEGYAGIAFTETSLLVTIGSLPNFVVTIYNWRKGDKVGQLCSNLRFEGQLIKCNWSKPVYVSQICRYHNKLMLWDVFTCCKGAVLAEHEIEPPKDEKRLKFLDIMWTTEGGLYVVDIRGCIFNLVNETYLEKVIEVNFEGDAPTFLCWYKGGIAVFGPNNEIRHYKKFGSWELDWTIPLETRLKFMVSNRSDYIMAVTEDEAIIKLSNTEGMVYLKQNENLFNNVCFIHPVGKYCMALRQNRILTLFQTNNGNLINQMELRHTVTAMADNPDFPYVAVGYDNGLLELISIYHPEKITVMTSFNLTKNPIATIKFFEQGRVIIAGFLDIGELFLIEGIPGTQMKVVACIHTNCQIVDYMLVASRNCHRLFTIPVTEKYLAGNKIVRYCIVTKDNINKKEYKFENTEYSYHRLVPTSKFNRDKFIYALPFNSRNIHELELRRGDEVAHLHSEIKTGHLLRKFELDLSRFYAITWGYDGFVIVRDNHFRKEVGMALPNHRYLGGVKEAYIHPLGEYILSLGRDNVVVCTKLGKVKIDPDRKLATEQQMESTKFTLMFKRPTIGFKPDHQLKNKTWLEVEQILHAEREKEICMAEKGAILQEFETIKSHLQELVTQNINGPDNEKLDLSEFYLDTALYNFKRDVNKQECKSTEIYLKALIEAQDRVSKYLMENCWHTMESKSQMVYGIFSRTEVGNFPLLPRDALKDMHLSWVQEQRKVEQFIKISDHFAPWMIINKDKLEEYGQPLCFKLDDYENSAKLMGTHMDETLATQSTETQVALTGSAIQFYTTVNPAHYDQRELVSFHQCHLEEIISERDILKLKMTFNKVFDDLVSVKQREMAVIKERNDRLRHIISEHNYFCENKVSLNIVDPQWSQQEIPEMITKVFDHELSVTPYISPSEQAILDAKAAEEERIRLALLADDFRERALMTMMNGVLEVKWEDELKKDVPLPKCMIEKQAENFNEEDLRTIKEYEEKVAFLNSERERYKNMLDGEFTKVTTFVRDAVRKFNQKVKESADYKMQIQSAIAQEHLTINRNRFIENERSNIFKKMEDLKKTMLHTEHTLTNLKKTIAFLQETTSECRTSLENLLLKDKVLEKSFKKDFQESSPVLQELSVKYYKKRPKVNFRQMTSYTLLYELAKCVISHERSPLLTGECLDYLRALDQLDQFVGLPPTVDENIFGNICKHRRLRIDYEIRVRAHQCQITDSETTISTFQRRFNLNRENNVKLTAELHQFRTDYLHLMHNLQMQVVLRRGLVELPLTGDISDFQDAILVPKNEIQNINKLILDAGNKKIHTIMQNMAFRRSIMITEWEHRKLRLTINDLTEQLEDIDGVKVGKDMQLYLKSKALGRKTELESFEVELERIVAAYENRIMAKKEKYDKLHKMIKLYKKGNANLDKDIYSLNIDVCHLKMIMNKDLQEKEQDVLKSRMEGLLKRSSLVQQIQDNQGEILVLQTELELLRLRTYPTFKYKLINLN